MSCSQSEVAGQTFLYNLVKIRDAVQPLAQAKVADQWLGGVVGGVQQPVDHLGLLRADDGKVEPDSSVLRRQGGSGGGTSLTLFLSRPFVFFSPSLTCSSASRASEAEEKNLGQDAKVGARIREMRISRPTVPLICCCPTPHGLSDCPRASLQQCNSCWKRASLLLGPIQLFHPIPDLALQHPILFRLVAEYGWVYWGT